MTSAQQDHTSDTPVDASTRKDRRTVRVKPQDRPGECPIIVQDNGLGLSLAEILEALVTP